MTNQQIIERIEDEFDSQKIFGNQIFVTSEVLSAIEYARLDERERILGIIDWIDGDVDNHDWINRKELKREIEK